MCGLELSRNQLFQTCRYHAQQYRIHQPLHLVPISFAKRCMSRWMPWSPTCEVIGSHSFNFTTWLVEIGSTLPLLLSRTTLSHPTTTTTITITATTTTPFYTGVKQCTYTHCKLFKGFSSLDLFYCVPIVSVHFVVNIHEQCSQQVELLLVNELYLKIPGASEKYYELQGIKQGAPLELKNGVGGALVRLGFNRTSSPMLNKYGESGQSCLVPDFSGIALNFSPFNLMVAVDVL
ncbi:hypothetical protein STEG23_022749 [Scotinomys teguina]